MKIVFAASEGVPYCKTGGLADVVGALTESLAQKKHQVLLFLPLYQSISKSKFKIQKTKIEISVPLGHKLETVSVWERTDVKNPRVLFIESDLYFRRSGIYGRSAFKAYPDNDERYATFSRAVLEYLKISGFNPDIIHCHDWQTGLIPLYLRFHFAYHPVFKKVPCVFTIHNMAYQGIFSKESIVKCGLPPSEFKIDGYEFYEDVNFLKSGLIYSDMVNTVSPTYAQEIKSDPRYGLKLEGVIQEISGKFKGILNGLDEKYWNPQTDLYLTKNFDSSNISGRRHCKMELQKKVGFEVNDKTPMLASISRLDTHKGVDILFALFPKLLKEDVQVIVLGHGNPKYEKKLAEFGKKYAKNFFFETKFSEELAHKIYAGTDLFLMPSLFEPCGLGQMIAMRYGAIPVVTPTGGLKDSVVPVGQSRSGTGFVSEDISSASFIEKVFEALSFIQNEQDKKKIQVQMMSSDFSWKKSLKEYEEMYRHAIQKK